MPEEGIMNPATIIILGIVILAAVAALFVVIRNKKRGKPLCGGDCKSCGGCRAYAEYDKKVKEKLKK